MTARLAPEPLPTESVEQLRFVSNAVPAVLAYLDTQARYVWANEGYRRWFGSSPDLVRGLHVSDVLGESAWAVIEPYVRRVLLGEEVTYSQLFSFKSGPPRHVRVNYAPDVDGDGRVRGFVVLANDISEIKSAESALRRSEHLLEQSQSTAHVGSWELIMQSENPAEVGRLTWSEEAFRIFGYQPNALKVTPEIFFNLIHPDDRENIRAISRAGIARGEPFEKEYRIVRPDGTERLVHAWTRFELGKDGKPARMLGTCQDITERKQADDEVRRIRAELELVMDSTAASILRCDAERRIIWCNKSNAARVGKMPEQIMGQLLREVEGEAAYLALESSIDRVLAGETVELETNVPHPSHGSRWMHVMHSPTPAMGRPDGWVSVLTDNTQRRHLERALRLSEERYRSLVGAITSVVWTADADGRFVEHQPAWESYTGQGAPEGPDWGWTAVVHEDDRARVEEEWERAAQTGAPFRVSCRVWHAQSAGYRFCEANAVAIRNADGSVREWIGTLVDQHERERALDELREADRRKDEFLAMLSHELRNPLAPILSSVEMLNRTRDDQQAAKCRAVIARQVQHMKRLLDDLLDVSRVSQGKIRLRKEPVDLDSLLLQAVEVSRPMIAEKRHELTTSLAPSPLLLDADPTRLVQVFANLVNNAAKYTDPGGHIAIRVSIEGGEAVVRVGDDGMGMHPDLLARVFDLFVQETRSLDRAQGGLGIGLTMVQTLVKMHGGSVRALSDGPGKGSEFVVRLPLGPTRPSPMVSSTAGKRADARPRTVLVVDDNTDAAHALGLLLELLGHQVRLAYDGPTALTVAAEVAPELVLLDIGLPGMDGYAVAVQLRQAGLRAVLIAVTGYGTDEHAQRSSEAGFNHHLVKPIDFAALRDIIDQLD